jgi:hypothetical protein
MIDRASASRPPGDWKDENVLADTNVVEHIFVVPNAPQDGPLDVGERPQRRHPPRGARLRATREAAMAAF